jgi:hypothetical protein
VRRELNRAQRSQRKSGKLRGMAEFNGGSQAPTDPFLARNQVAQQGAAAAPAPSGQTPQAELSAVSIPTRLPAIGSQTSAQPGQPVANPFAAQPAGGRIIAGPDQNREIELAGATAERAASPAAEVDANNSQWPLPNALAPPPLPAISTRTDATSGLADRASNQFSAELNDTPTVESSKQQALAHLQAARTALEAGDI